MSEPATDLIPSEVMNLRAIYERRCTRRKEALDEKQREIVKGLEPLIVIHRKALYAFEDHCDAGMLKYGRDPNKMATNERDPAEVKESPSLKRAVDDAEAQLRSKDIDLTAQLKSLPEYQAFRAAQAEFEDWISNVCLHLRCCAEDLDWQTRKIKRYDESGQIPTTLLAVPNEFK